MSPSSLPTTEGSVIDAIKVFEPQRSAGWREARLGKVTASRLADLTGRTKTGWSASRGVYMSQLIVERLTGVALQAPLNAAMRWGVEHERRALAAYSFRTDRDPLETGFWSHPRIDQSGASPDGLVGFAGLVEVKCPTTPVHLETLEAKAIPAKYLPQMNWQMACTGRSWCDFVSFDPRLPEPLRMYVARLFRNEEVIADLEQQVQTFLAELDQRVIKLSSSGPQRCAA